MNATESPHKVITTDDLRLPPTCDPPSEDNPHRQAVWLIFGATGHLGRSLTRTCLNRGDRVTAVGRIYENSLEQMQNWHIRCHGMLCDVRIRESVEAVVQGTIKKWGSIDIIVNCTGYGVVAAAEDQSSDDLRNQFNTNFMGTLHILQSSMPYFRMKHRNETPGRFLIFSSTAGALGVPGMAPYCATKYAVEGLVESMLYEVHCFGIKATLVEPGFIRDDDGSKIAEANLDKIKRYGHFSIHPNPSDDYSSTTSPANMGNRIFQWLDKRQPTSAVQSMELIWQLGHCSYPPLRLLLGSYAVESIRDRLRSVIEEIEDWKHLNFAVDEDDHKNVEETGGVSEEGAEEEDMEGD